MLTWRAETNAFGNLFFSVERASSPGGPFTTVSAPLCETSHCYSVKRDAVN